MKRSFNQQMSLGFGIFLLLLGGGIGLIVGMQNLGLWWTTFVLGIVLILRSFIFEGESFDEREQMINYKGFKATFIITIILAFIFYSLYFWFGIQLPGEDAFIIYLGLIILAQGLSSFYYAKKI
ncbi:hypothetical protein ERX37_09560 [Macrococcus hajekii]|uniref:Uncharacterized protein n=1 Tax=Macrococcus hajekii TaxID=198482 RepID=A0A4R6BIA5_9STAP|nr:hypothetical protein [Macrococcus hajekii]TDM01349.1 hypothetical protein ERX37_09560 [Macrococcus hajekii]GGB10895.1 hypothetical protein GCM10007190_18700 [Macrococcus hajekii]